MQINWNIDDESVQAHERQIDSAYFNLPRPQGVQVAIESGMLVVSADLVSGGMHVNEWQFMPLPDLHRHTKPNVVRVVHTGPGEAAVHGVALAILLPHVVRWNSAAAAPGYADLLGDTVNPGGAGDRLAARLRTLADRAGLPARLQSEGVTLDNLPQLADDAARQWTGSFNPRPFAASDAMEIYRCAF